MNQPENDNDNDNDDTGDTTPNPQPDNTGNSSPVAISGMWEIVSGHGVNNVSTAGNTHTMHFKYVEGSRGAIGIEVSRNTYGGSYEGAYCVTLTGEGLEVESLQQGFGSVRLNCTIDEYPEMGTVPMMTFSGGLTFDYIGNGSYQSNNDTELKYAGATNRAMPYSSTLTLENATTLRWKYEYRMETSGGEIQQEILLRKVQ